ncbi:MAG: enoyl-CoA hydratase/isomerase family protein [Bacteroidia bacterium]|nr:enoyl-CoA hydratase/isomerase family protein [Bacteroidia bacterium]
MKKIKLSYSHNEAVANILLDDGKGNVLDNTMMQDILACFQLFKTNHNLKLITFQGQGKHFSFGASVEEHTYQLAGKMLKTFHQIFIEIIEMQIPTLAKVSGQCLGGGMELALVCNFIFADKTAKFGQPEIILGVFPPPASIILPEKIGLARAEDILLTGKTIDAEEALKIGLLNAVYEDKNILDAEVDGWIEKYILPKSASSLRFANGAARVKFSHIISNFLNYLEQTYTQKLMETKDANEGIQAFLEKRKPNWSNN